MNILITGGTGFVGGRLLTALATEQHLLTILTRQERESSNPFVSYRKWDGKKMPLALGFYDVVINLAGAPIAEGRWTAVHKKMLLDSRLDATQACVDFINGSIRKPEVFLSGSAVGIYGGVREEEVDEKSKPGTDFVGDFTQQWEQVAAQAKCQTILLRIGVVLGKEGGALAKLRPLYKRWLGGRIGSGKQAFPWVHIGDVVGAICFLMGNEKAEGPVNITAPEYQTQAEFSEKYAHSLGVMDLFPLPKIIAKIIFGEKSIILLGGQKVKPAALEKLGYSFKFPTLKEALKEEV